LNACSIYSLKDIDVFLKYYRNNGFAVLSSKERLKEIFSEYAEMGYVFMVSLMSRLSGKR